MQISVWVPYDEAHLRRTLRFVIRPQLRFVRVMGAVAAVLGLLLLVLDPSLPLAYGAVAIGLLCAFAVEPITVARSVKLQSHVIKDGFRLVLDDEWVTLSYPLAESRFRWAGLGRAIETPEGWYVMFGKLQAITIPKEPMTAQQRAEFAAFVGRLPLAGDRPAVPGGG